jgi:UDP-N-acetylglucosamine--dolichyl-phosphate N-acetylglucosaminephosphotransferase
LCYSYPPNSDIHFVTGKTSPEALGIVPGAVFLVCLILCLVGFNYRGPDDDKSTRSTSSSNLYRVLEINTSLLAICFMLFLGFTDDVLDWPWRYKLILPTIASLPLITCYNGSTTIVVPIQLRSLFWDTEYNTITGLGTVLQYIGIHIDPRNGIGSLMDLGYIYLFYMSMLAVFCTNAINIYAGINGLEAGQSYIIATSILTYNCIELIHHRLMENHIFSIMVVLCFTGVTLGLLQHNWFPAKVFVGDTFCYFAGMTFAVVGIFGHYSKTLLLFFIPQICNFLWSVPQLFHFVPCPRHRLPSYNAITGYMEPSTFACKPNEYKWLKRIGHQNVNDTQCVNMTIINACLQICGPMSERTLCITLLIVQMVCCTFGFLCRYYLAGFFFEN